ncbi:MAG: hypothetical protein K2H39_08845, partial [Paramuribaculum sp.]|nr:hypothetical protein [Paramuribaculum sp.]
MWKYIFAIITVITLSIEADAQTAKSKRSAASVRKEQQATKKQIRETTQKINVNTRETKKQLSRLNSLNGEIDAKGVEISKIQTGVDSINRHITDINDSIGSLNKHIEALRTSYIQSLRKLQGTTGSMGQLAFIFSSGSFSEAYRNVRYMQQFDRWRKRKFKDIKATEALLTERKTELDNVCRARNIELSKLNTARKELEPTREET